VASDASWLRRGGAGFRSRRFPAGDARRVAAATATARRCDWAVVARSSS
jgi:hypothetical protein